MRLAVPIKFKRIHQNAVIPQHMTAGAACVDLVATEIEYVDEDKVTVKFGFSTEFSDGYKVHIMPRSSFSHKDWVMQNLPGVIDSDYRGEWMCKFQAIPIGFKLDYKGAIDMDNLALEYSEFPYKVGERVLQASVEVNIHMKWKESKELSTTIRGEGGFGSTNK